MNRAAIQAGEVILRQANGDYTPDPEANRFPKTVLPDPSKTFKALWADFCKARKRDPERARRALHFFDSMIEHVGTDDMRAVTEEHLLTWRDKLQDSGLGQKTIKEGYFAAVKSFFKWAKRQKKLPTDPSAEVFIEGSDDGKDMRGLTEKEANTILSATLAPPNPLMTAENIAARRWVAWLCAYTGARLNEITQLRAMDVQEIDGIRCVEITPKAGPLKNKGSERTIPLHPHLIEQGFVEFAMTKKGSARLFYSEERTTARSPARNLGNKLGEWVRDLGIVDKEVAPFH